MKVKRSIFLWLILFIFLTTYNFNLDRYIEKSLFPIKKIQITGINYLNKDEINLKLKKFKGKSIFIIREKKIKDIFKNFDFIQEVEIKKIYPDKILVNIREFEPLAYFKKNNEIYLLTDTKKIIKNNKLVDIKNLPEMYGNGGEKNFHILNKSLIKIGFDKKIIEKFSYFQINRWDIFLNNDKIIKLPVKNYEDSLKKFLSIFREEQFENFKIFDFRIEDQLILK